MDSILQAIINSVTTFKAVFPFDCMIAVADKERFLSLIPGIKMKIDNPVGQPITQGDGLWEAVHEKRICSNIVDKAVWGFPFKNISTPIRNIEGEVIGAMGLAYSLENQETLQNAAETIATTAEEVIASSEELSANASKLNEELDSIRVASELMVKNLDQSDKMLLFIKNIAANTKLLGLNASIEAARAGEQGLGFSVVANEIGRLSANSSSSVEEIKEILEGIRGEMVILGGKIAAADQISSQQEAATQEITESIESLTMLAEKIQDLALKV